MNWSARGNVLNQYLRNTSIGTTVIMRMLTLSLPGALLVGMDIIMFLTLEQETGSKLNISDSYTG